MTTSSSLRRALVWEPDRPRPLALGTVQQERAELAIGQEHRRRVAPRADAIRLDAINQRRYRRAGHCKPLYASAGATTAELGQHHRSLSERPRFLTAELIA